MFRIIYSAFAVNGRTNNSHQPWIRSFGKMMQAQYMCVYVLLAKIHKLQPYHKFHPAMCCCRCKSMEIWCAFYFVCFINHRLCSLARKLWLDCHRIPMILREALSLQFSRRNVNRLKRPKCECEWKIQQFQRFMRGHLYTWWRFWQADWMSP